MSVTDRTKSAGALVFTVEISFATSGPTTGHTSTAEVPVAIEIPSAHRTEAAALARRYREQLER